MVFGDVRCILQISNSTGHSMHLVDVFHHFLKAALVCQVNALGIRPVHPEIPHHDV
jgi:hypothetical protein